MKKHFHKFDQYRQLTKHIGNTKPGLLARQVVLRRRRSATAAAAAPRRALPFRPPLLTPQGALRLRMPAERRE